MADTTSCRKSKMAAKCQPTVSSYISESMKHIIIIPTATTVFGVHLYSGSTSGFERHRCVLEIQDGSQITKSSNNFAGFCCDYVQNIQMATSNGRRYLVSKIQDGCQPTGSSNISETMKHIFKIPTATTMFSGSTFLVAVLPISWDVDVC